MPSTSNKKTVSLVIFGASGDLAKLKLFPALYKLAEKNLNVVGFARSKISDSEFKKIFNQSVKSFVKKEGINSDLIKELSKNLTYVSGQYNDPDDFKKLKDHLNKIAPNSEIIAYFSVPPTAFGDIIKNLGENFPKNQKLKLVIEKPFGQDYKSAQELYHFVSRYFKEEQIYLLDHYLGKTAVQSILALRHNNRLLNLMMKGPEIANIQITGIEKVGVENRVSYFDQVGIIKDMIQSHLLQILALVSMSIPISESAEALHHEKYAILSTLKFEAKKENLTIGQYKSYKKLKGVPANSQTETYASVKLFLDRESWYKVPIHIRTGKSLKSKRTYVTVEIKKFAFQDKEAEPNRLIFSLHPEEKIEIRLVNTYHGSNKFKEVITDESLACDGENCLPEHAVLIKDVIKNNRINFLSFEEILATWKITDEILKFKNSGKIKLQIYDDNSDGPKDKDFKWCEI